MYDPSTGIWTATPKVRAAHDGATPANVLPDAMVLLAGGLDKAGLPTAAAEFFHP